MQFVLISLLLVISFSIKSFAQARLKASPAKSQVLCSQELNPHPPLPKKLKNALDTLVRVRTDLNNNPHLETIYLSKLQELKIQFLAHQIGEEVFDRYFIAAYQQKLKKISATEEDVKEVQVETQKEHILYPLKGRTPQVIKAISHALNLPADTINWEDLKKLKGLDLSHKNLTKLKENDFEGLTSLTHLNLSNNSRLKTLPPKIFSNLKILERIYLHRCGLTKISESLFRRLNKLTGIYLSHNNLKEIPITLFRGLKNLNYLELSNNPLKNFSFTLLNELNHLKILYLAGLQITFLPKGAFDKFNNLEFLDLSYNNLKKLPKLKNYHITLLINDNKIQNLSQKDLNNLKKLSTLSSITNNPLDHKTEAWIIKHVSFASNILYE